MIKHLLSTNYLSLHINMIVQIIYKFISSLFQFTFSSKTPFFFQTLPDFYLSFLCVWEFCLCVGLHTIVLLVPEGARRRFLNPWDWSNSQL